MKVDTSRLLAYASVLTAAAPIQDQDPRLLLEKDGDLAIYYLPFEFVNASARVAIVGITPGPTQLIGAAAEAGRLLRDGVLPEDILQATKRLAAFSGEPMRSNLTKQLDNWGLHDWLGLGSSVELFMTSGQHLVHNTSLLRNATYVKGKPYAGTPPLMSSPLLRVHHFQHFVEETRQLSPETLYFSMGPAVEAVLLQLVAQGILKADQVMAGLFHPSPNNTYRITYATGDRQGDAPWKTNVAAFDEGRRRFRRVCLGS